MLPNTKFTHLHTYTLTHLHTKRGQALLFVFFLLLIVGILGGALAVMWQAEIQTRAAERDGLIAFYLAQAGIERAKIWTKSNCGFSISSGWFTDLGAGRYSFTVSGATRGLNSTGQALTSGNVIAERQITLRVNPGCTAQVNWSWREQ